MIDLGVFDQDVLGVLVVFLTKDDRVRVFEPLPEPGQYYLRRSTWYRRAWSPQDVSESMWKAWVWWEAQAQLNWMNERSGTICS